MCLEDYLYETTCYCWLKPSTQKTLTTELTKQRSDLATVVLLNNED